MRKYTTMFKMYFLRTLQYRTAAWAGIITQFIWGFLEILVFRAFYQDHTNDFPMLFSELTSYIWLQQAFLSLYMLWFFESEIFEMIQSGQLSYELVRPLSLYQTWFTRTVSIRMARASLRCLPVLLVAMVLPANFRLSLPLDKRVLFWFLCSMLLALLVIVAMSMLIYFISFYTIDSGGIRMVFLSAGEFLSGAVLPLPFLPPKLQQVLSWLPFASAQNVPFRIYSGNLSGNQRNTALLLQLFWLITLVFIGKLMENKIMKQVVIQGG